MSIEEKESSPLEEVEVELREAKLELADAERKIENAEEAIERAIEKDHKHFQVKVLYDGVKKPFEVRIEETIKALLDVAIATFGPLPNPHTLSIWKGGTELNDTQTIKEAGVEPHDVLLLRPSKVKGGA